MHIRGYGRSVIGSREINQDYFAIMDDEGFYAVADGVGGGMKGEVASQMAVEGVKKRFQSSSSLKPAFEEMQKAIYQEAMDEFQEPIMGTTLTVVRIVGDTATLCHAGDSRCYLFDGAMLRQISEDHESFDERYQGTVLSSYLGIPPEVQPLTIQEENFTLQPGNRILLCSDGLYRQIEETRLVALIRNDLETPNPEGLIEEACREAAKTEYSDNITLVYIVCE